MRVRVIFDGTEYSGDPEDFDAFRDEAFRGRVAREGIFLRDDGTAMDGAELNRARARFSGAGSLLREMSLTAEGGAFDEAEYQPLIPGLLNRGTQPMLIGQKGAGKSRLALDLLEVLVVPERRMFGVFHPPDLPPEEWVVYLNAENPPHMIESEIERRGMNAFSRNPFRVEHLPRMGGPTVFDITDRKVFLAWADWLSQCNVCQTRKEDPPAVAIVDGLTAVLGGPSNRYGEWVAAFRDLMAYIGLPTAVVVAHSTYDGQHPLGGTEGGAGSDGIWFYTKGKSGHRTFKTEPRFDDTLEVAPMRIVMGPDGRLVAARTREPDVNEPNLASPEVGATTALPTPTIEERVLTFVEESNAAGDEPKLDAIRRGVRGDATRVDAAVRGLVTDGQLTFTERPGRGLPAKLYRVIPTRQTTEDARAEK